MNKFSHIRSNFDLPPTGQTAHKPIISSLPDFQIVSKSKTLQTFRREVSPGNNIQKKYHIHLATFCSAALTQVSQRRGSSFSWEVGIHFSLCHTLETQVFFKWKVSQNLFKMQLFVRGQQQHVVEVSEQDTVLQIKERVSVAEGIPVQDLKLYASGAPLTDDVAAASLETEDLELNVGLLGGKVHGSLARAGKVKGQTPKVEKQEKKKKKTGRAKRRFQYNRRFVNIVQGFGRKRGPNAAPVS